MSGLFWLALEPFLITLVLTPIFRDICRSYNVVDRPGLRKVHAYPIPRMGGIPIVIAYAIPLISFTEYRLLNPSYDSPVWRIVPGMAITFLTGVADDFFNLRPSVKLLGQLSAAAVVVTGGLRIDSLAGVSLPYWISVGLTIFWLLLTSNAFNLIDGLDGLCGGMGFFASLTLFVAALLRSDYSLIHASIPLAGALLAFLFYNFNPATVFLGDSGSLTIGFLIGCFGVMWNQKTTTVVGLVIPLLAVLIPLLEVALSVARRGLKGQPLFAADRGHIHHRLLDRGLSVRRVAFTVYGAALLVVVFAMLFSIGELGAWRILVGFLFLFALWAGIRRLRYAEFNVTLRLLFNGEFRRVIAEKTRSEYLAVSLDQARTEDAWWSALVAAGREAGWSRLQWTGTTPPREQILDARPPLWSFSIDLGTDQKIRIDGGAKPGTDLVLLADIVQRTLSAKRRQWEQPTLS